MPVVAYVDPDSVHNPAAAGVPPASWFTTIESDLRSITGVVSACIYNDTTEDFALPGPTVLSLPDTMWNNGMTVASNSITVPSSYGGKYDVCVGARVTSIPSALNTVALGVTVNGTVVVEEISSRSGASGFLDTISRTFGYLLAVGDVVRLSCTTQGLSDADTEVSISQPTIALYWRSA